MHNATVHIDFPSFSTTYPVEWTGKDFVESENLGEYLMFNGGPEIDKAYESGSPEVYVTLDANPAIRSQVILDDVCGLALPAWNLKQATARANAQS